MDDGQITVTLQVRHLFHLGPIISDEDFFQDDVVLSLMFLNLCSVTGLRYEVDRSPMLFPVPLQVSGDFSTES
jgi:hypothetical protein